MNRSTTLIFRILVFALLFTGLAQMPIFARYYLADIPGFAWTADYYFNHVLHYGLATILLFFLGSRLVPALRNPWTTGGIALSVSWVGVVGTGIIRVMKNQPDVFFSPTFVVLIDWGHLGFVMLLGLISLIVTMAAKIQGT